MAPPPKQIYYSSSAIVSAAYCLILIMSSCLIFQLSHSSSQGNVDEEPPAAAGSSDEVSFRPTTAFDEDLDEEERVSVSLYYESLCPYCANFIVHKLVKLFTTDIGSIVNLRLIPWGNTQTATTNNAAWICQHGSDECLLNLVEACAISSWNNMEMQFRLVYCIERLHLENRHSEWESCFSGTGLSLLARVDKTSDDSGMGGKPRGPEASHGGNPISKLKIDMPKCDGSDPLGWLFKDQEYFTFYGIPEESRLSAVCLMLEGAALDWFRWKQCNHLLPSWPDFVTKFKLRFDPLNYVDYFGLLSKVRQTGSVLDYQQAFEKVLVNVTDSLSASFALARELEAKHAAWASSILARPTSWGKPGQLSSTPPLLPTPGAKPTTATPPTQPPIRRLSRAEKLERDAKGLCYNCDEKWTKGHCCGRFLLLIEDEDDADDQQPLDVTVLAADVSSLNSMAGVTTPRSLRLSGMLSESVVEVLIDGGSTHNFIHPSIVERLHLTVHDVPAFRVYVGNGASLVCNMQCRDLQLLLQGTVFPVDVYVLSIHGPDIVLGVQWLQLLGRVTHDYAKLTMEFLWQGEPFALCGGTQTPKAVTVHHCHALYVKQEIAACFEITLSDHVSQNSSSDFNLPDHLPAAIREVLLRHQSVSDMPTGLPPRRLADHRIFLQLGSDPVNPITEILQQIRAENMSQPDLVRLHAAHRGGLLQPPYTVEDCLLFYNRRLCIDAASDLRTALLREYHDTPTAGHAGVSRTFQRLAANFFWLNMRRDVRRHIGGCVICQATKFSTQPLAGLLQPLPIPHRVWEDVSMDFITDLPVSRGYSVILVVVDRFSKYAHFGPLLANYDAHRTAFLFVDMVIKLHGFPRTIVSDRDKIFTSTFWRELHHLSGTTLNQQYSLNTSYHAGIRTTPFQAVYGRPPPELVPYRVGTSQVAAVEDVLAEREALIRQLRDNLKVAQNRMKVLADTKRREVTYAVGDWVLLRLQPYRQYSVTRRSSQKLSLRFYGPFQITERIGEVAYCLRLPETSKIHPVFHVSVLRPYRSNRPEVNVLPLPKTLLHGCPISEPVKAHASRRILRHGVPEDQWLVSWNDGSLDDATWEPVTLLREKFPQLHLEDKVAIEGRGNDTTTEAQVVGEEPRGETTTTEPRRSGRLEEAYGAETASLNPTHRFVPWVVVNNQPLQEDYENFESYICRAYMGSRTPEACKQSFSSAVNMVKKTSSSPLRVCVRE
ncbi:unnamed protein product [Cuscuta campestris]|uniref:Integrase catalytic domain-containing protein n=1 Tax=Cuscuta campestris TaxID=132261 RepID=A0A484KW82_9ASTE|nr:unnamed protein product [Cuscuta campestris]